MAEGLKLKAATADDVTVLSAALEGSITSSGEMGYASTSRAFTMTASRFMWERHNAEKNLSLRTRAGLIFSDVLSVKTFGVSREDPEAAMELLSLNCLPGNDGTAEIELNFAGGETLRLAVECIDIALTDVGDTWETDQVPSHPDADTDDISQS